MYYNVIIKTSLCVIYMQVAYKSINFNQYYNDVPAVVPCIVYSIS